MTTQDTEKVKDELRTDTEAVYRLRNRALNHKWAAEDFLLFDQIDSVLMLIASERDMLEQQLTLSQQARDRAERERDEAVKREAECHDVITGLWAVTDPEVVGEALMERVHEVLGVNAPNGECGNPICARRAAEQANP